MSFSFTTNAGSLAANKRALADKVGEQFRQLAQKQAGEMRAAAQRLSSGTLPATQLARMGHPYRVGLMPGAAGFPDELINLQKGTLRAGWRVRAQKTDKGWTLTIWNVDPASKFLLGTRKSRARPILERVMKQTGEELPRGVKKIIRQAIAQNGTGTFSPRSTAGAVMYAVAVGVASAAGALESAL